MAAGHDVNLSMIAHQRCAIRKDRSRSGNRDLYKWSGWRLSFQKLFMDSNGPVINIPRFEQAQD
jgi:hypothetical protein